jgi:hypothetical protein
MEWSGVEMPEDVGSNYFEEEKARKGESWSRAERASKQSSKRANEQTSKHLVVEYFEAQAHYLRLERKACTL